MQQQVVEGSEGKAHARPAIRKGKKSYARTLHAVSKFGHCGATMMEIKAFVLGKYDKIYRTEDDLEKILKALVEQKCLAPTKKGETPAWKCTASRGMLELKLAVDADPMIFMETSSPGNPMHA